MRKPETATDAHLRLKPDSAAKMLDNTPADGQSQAGAFGEGIKFHKAVEHLPYRIRSDTDTRICYGKFDLIGILLKVILKSDLPFARKLKGVIDKVGDDLHQTLLVRINTIIGQIRSQQHRHKFIFLDVVAAKYVLTKVFDVCSGKTCFFSEDS